PDELEGYSQDAIAGIVQRYVTPPRQCTIGCYSREGSTVRHPVITVPGSHRTPLWAARSSPDEQTLRTDTVYVRAPAGFSETARTQDDWERRSEERRVGRVLSTQGERYH